LLCGVLLVPANHTVTAALCALGLAGEPGFQNYHRLLNRARWSARQVAGVLFRLLVEAFVPSGPLIEISFRPLSTARRCGGSGSCCVGRRLQISDIA
jgi:hypothetical protein